MSGLSYSLHIGNDKNKTKNARRMARTSMSGATSFSNNAIQNARQLSKVDNVYLFGVKKNLNIIMVLYKNPLEKILSQYVLSPSSIINSTAKSCLSSFAICSK